MDKTKRLCPACGAANSLERENCHICGAQLRSDLPVPLEERLPVPWKEVGTSLAIGAGALALRVGVHLVRQLLERKARSTTTDVRPPLPGKVTRWLPRREEAQESSRGRLQVRMGGRRLRGRWSGDKASYLEIEEFYWQGVKNER